MTSRPADSEATSPEVLGRFVGELVDASIVLDDLDEAAPAEAWASGAVAEWVALGRAPGELATRLIDASPSDRTELAAALISWIAGAEFRRSVSLWPDWVDDVDRHDLVRAARVGSDGESAVVVEFVSPSGAQHSASVTIIDGRIVDCTLGPADLIGATESTGHFDVEAIALDTAMTLVTSALASGPELLSSEDGHLNYPALARRFVGADNPVTAIAAPAATSTSKSAVFVAEGERSVDDDLYAANLIRSALRIGPELFSDGELPDDVAASHVRFAELVEVGDPDALVLFEVLGGPGLADGHVSFDHYLRCVAAYLAPVDLSAHEPASRMEIAELEWADWVGVLLGLVRGGPGQSVDGRTLVDHINRCPELTTTIPAAERERFAWAFEQVLFAWEVTGVLDERGALTEAGVWLLPRAAIAVWSPA